METGAASQEFVANDSRMSPAARDQRLLLQTVKRECSDDVSSVRSMRNPLARLFARAVLDLFSLRATSSFE